MIDGCVGIAELALKHQSQLQRTSLLDHFPHEDRGGHNSDDLSQLAIT